MEEWSNILGTASSLKKTHIIVFDGFSVAYQTLELDLKIKCPANTQIIFVSSIGGHYFKKTQRGYAANVKIHNVYSWTLEEYIGLIH